MCCDLAASSLDWFVLHFVALVVVGVLFHVDPPVAVSAVFGFEGEVSVVRVSVGCYSVVVSHHFFDCQVYQVGCVGFRPEAVDVDCGGLVV